MPGQVTFAESMTGFVRPCPPAQLPSWGESFDATVFDAASSTAGPASALELSDLTLRVQTEPGPDDGLDGVALSGLLRWDDREYRVTGGEFVALAATPSGRRLRYRLVAESDDSARIVLAGVKIVSGRPTRWWRDTTHMYTLIIPGPHVALAGQLQLSLEEFARQIGTFTGGLGPVSTFLWRFTQRLIRSPKTHRDQCGRRERV